MHIVMLLIRFLIFLDLFYDSNITFSDIYYPTDPLLILHHILDIVSQLHTYENDFFLKKCCSFYEI